MKYQVKEGYTFGGAVLLPAGSFVDLTETEAAAFLDKLQPVESGEPEATPAAPEQAEERLVVSVPDAEPAEPVKGAESASKRKGQG